MHIQPRLRPMVLGPSEIQKLSTAYEAALSAIIEADGRAKLPAHKLRHQIAATIMDKARHGDFDPDHLKQAALQSLPSIRHPRRE
jgi:hypothetical protein